MSLSSLHPSFSSSPVLSILLPQQESHSRHIPDLDHRQHEEGHILEGRALLGCE